MGGGKRYCVVTSDNPENETCVRRSREVILYGKTDTLSRWPKGGMRGRGGEGRGDLLGSPGACGRIQKHVPPVYRGSFV